MPDIAVGAKRYDGGSGSAVFTGCIPLKPSQLFDTDLATVALWNGGTEIGCTASALYPRHPDGSVKVVRVSTTLTLASGVQQDLTLRLGTTRLVSGPAEPTITKAWLRAPRLIGATDAAHCCASRIAHLPLIPATHPNLPPKWKTFLTTEFSTPQTDPYGAVCQNWAAGRSAVLANQTAETGIWGWSDATYDATSIVYQWYLVTGSLDALADAHAAAGCDASLGGAGRALDTYKNGTLTYASAFESHPVGEVIPTEVDWVSSNGSVGVSGVRAEWYSTYHDLWYTYVLSGSLHALHNLIGHGCATLGIYSTDYAAGDYHQDTNGARMMWRNTRLPELYLYLLSLPFDVTFHSGAPDVTAVSPRTDAAWYVTRFQDKWWHNFEWWATQNVARGWAGKYGSGFDDVTPLSSDGHNWHYGCWGFSPLSYFNEAGGSVVGNYPLFQTVQAVAISLMMYLQIPAMQSGTDAVLFPARLLKFCRAVKAMFRDSAITLAGDAGPLPLARYWTTFGGTGSGAWVNELGQSTTPPADGAPWNATAVLLVLTYGGALTSDATERAALFAAADRLATIHSYVEANGHRAGAPKLWKETGEIFGHAYPAGAFRSGVPFNSWDLGDTVNPTALTGQTALTFTAATPTLNLTSNIALAAEGTLAFVGTTPVLGPTGRYPVTRTAVTSPARPIRSRDMRLRSTAPTLEFVGLGLLTHDLSLASAGTFDFSGFGRLQTPTIAETFTHANTTSGISADHTWGLLAGTAFKINNNMAVIENAPNYVTQMARLDSTLLSANDFDHIALIGDWLIASSDAWLGIGGFNDAAATGYGAHVAWDGFQHTVSLWKWVAGAPTRITTPVIVNAPTPGNTHLRVRRIASTGVTTAFYAGAQVAEVTDTAIVSDLKNVGLWAGMGSVSGTCRLGVDLVTADVAA